MAVYMPETDTLYVDNTTLTTYKSCKTLAMVTYGYNLQPPDVHNTPMQAGIALHHGVETYYLTQDIEAAVDAFVHNYRDHDRNAIADSNDRYSMVNLIKALTSWEERNKPITWEYIIHPDLVEIPFEVLLNPNDPTIRFVGRLDALVEGKKLPDQPDRRPVRFVLDNKSTGQNITVFNRQFIMSSQLSGYIYAAQQTYGDQFDINAAYIMVISTQTPPSSNARCARHGAKYTECGYLHPPHGPIGPFFRSPGQIEEWRVNAYNLAIQWRDALRRQIDKRDLAGVLMDGMFQYGQCNTCSLLDFCRAGRPAHYGFEYREWLPGDLADNPPPGRLIWKNGQPATAKEESRA